MNPPADTDRKYIKRRDDSKNHSWQFQFEVDPIKESKVFSDSKYGSREAALEAAKKHRDDFLRSAFELGLVAADGSPLRDELPLVLTLSPKNTSGIVGVHRADVLRKGRAQREVAWVANYQDAGGKNKQKAFYVAKSGERPALLSAIRLRRDFVAEVARKVSVPAKKSAIEAHVHDLDFLIEYIELLPDDSEVFLFLSTLNNPLVPTTEKQRMLAVRIAQARFRSLVSAVWGSRCPITGAVHFLVAGHIKPWSVATDAERVDPYNGLLLSPIYDKAFDSGLITFEDNGVIRVSDRLRADAARLNITGRETIAGLSDGHRSYLAYHREHCYKPA